MPTPSEVRPPVPGRPPPRRDSSPITEPRLGPGASRGAVVQGPSWVLRLSSPTSAASLTRGSNGLPRLTDGLMPEAGPRSFRSSLRLQRNQLAALVAAPQVGTSWSLQWHQMDLPGSPSPPRGSCPTTGNRGRPAEDPLGGPEYRLDSERRRGNAGSARTWPEAKRDDQQLI